jgi:hypothetical protein
MPDGELFGKNLLNLNPSIYFHTYARIFFNSFLDFRLFRAGEREESQVKEEKKVV